jgi:hypothetical protein
MGTPSVRGPGKAVEPFLLPAVVLQPRRQLRSNPHRNRRNSEYTRRIKGIANKM